jgi:hypothetical protein
MKLVKEHINEFQQGKNPYDTMDIGSNRTPQFGDEIIILRDLYWDRNIREWGTKVVSGNTKVEKNSKAEITDLGEPEYQCTFSIFGKRDQADYCCSWDWLKKYNNILYKLVK